MLQARFVMKTDDDMYVNIGNILQYLDRDHSNTEKLITGKYCKLTKLTMKISFTITTLQPKICS